MMPSLNSPKNEFENFESVQTPKIEESISDNSEDISASDDTKPNVSQLTGGGITMMNFANGTMKVPNFVITNIKSLTSVYEERNEIPGSNLQKIVPVTGLQHVVPISDMENITPGTKIKTFTKMQSYSPVTQLIKQEKGVTSSQDSPQWLNSPIRKYVARKRISQAGTSSLPKVQNVDQEHAYVSKYQSPIITMKKLIVPQSPKSSKILDNTCRLCLKFREKLTPLIWGERAKPELKIFLKECCSVEVNPDDPLPKSICCECRLKLLSAWEFRNQCQKSDNELRKFHKLPYKNYSQPRIDDFVKQVNKGIQVECYDRSKKSKVLRSIKQEKIDEEEAVTLETVMNYENFEVEKPGIEESNVEETFVEESNVAVNDSEENDDKGENAVTFFLESFAQEISNDAENLDDDHSTELKENVDSETQETPKKKMTKKRIIRKKKSSPVEKGNFLCHMCPRVFTTKGFLERHAKHHLTEKTFTCETCSKVFKTEEKLTIHMRIHDKTKRFECEVCGLKYVYEYLLNSHLRLHGKGKPLNTEKHYLCEVCSKTFASQSGLKHHQKLHMNLKPFKCRFCEKTFTMPIYRKKHELRHSDTREFKCHLCPATYISTNGLTNHLLLHTGEAHYHCNICGKSFRRRKYLNEHTFTHTGEKPYACKLCGISYGNSGSLFAHQKRCRMHQIQKEEEPVLEVIETETLVEDLFGEGEQIDEEY